MKVKDKVLFQNGNMKRGIVESIGPQTDKCNWYYLYIRHNNKSLLVPSYKVRKEND